MIAPKIKVGISIFLTESGQIGFQSTSKNMHTIVGLVEDFKLKLLSGGFKAEVEPLIQPATEMPIETPQF